MRHLVVSERCQKVISGLVEFVNGFFHSQATMNYLRKRNVRQCTTCNVTINVGSRLPQQTCHPDIAKRLPVVKYG
jgi:hypothetical protein